MSTVTLALAALSVVLAAALAVTANALVRVERTRRQLSTECSRLRVTVATAEQELAQWRSRQLRAEFAARARAVQAAREQERRDAQGRGC